MLVVFAGHENSRFDWTHELWQQSRLSCASPLLDALLNRDWQIVVNPAQAHLFGSRGLTGSPPSISSNDIHDSQPPCPYLLRLVCPREVSGDGVIGEYPLLSLAAPAAGNVSGNVPVDEDEDEDPCIFEYESCTTLENTPGEAMQTGFCECHITRYVLESL